MRPDEIRDAGGLTSTALAELTELARDTHKALAGRLFGLAGRPGQAVGMVHDGIAAIAYESTRLGLKYGPAAAGMLGSMLQDEDAPSSHDAPRGRFVLGALNGFWGDRIATERDALAPVMRVRLHDGPLRRVPANVAFDAREGATGRLVLFAHGLCETDQFWWFGAERNWGDPDTTYGRRLREDDGWTPLYLTYNTGAHISANGRELAWLIGALVEEWPVPVTEIALVGHSMGGLVVRSAAHQADESGEAWVKRLSHVIGLGTPHMGAPLERFVNWGTHRLARLPETRPLAQWLNRRSVGIKDLRYGSFIDADWDGHDLDELLTDRCTDAQLVPGVAYSMVSATLSREPEGLFAHDLLVAHTSAHGRGRTPDGRSIPFETDRAFHLGGRRHHFDLLNDPDIYARLHDWLSGEVAVPVADDTRPRRRRLRSQKRRSA